ncbi:MAG TPA: hypothetical protein VGI85_05110 [Chthoniobacterales bacterium]
MGAKDFLNRLLEKSNGKTVEHHGGHDRSHLRSPISVDHDRERVGARGMEGRTVGEETKGAAVNVAIARRLREETTMPLK